MSDTPSSSIQLRTITLIVVPSRPHSSHISEFGRGDGHTRLHSPVEEGAERIEHKIEEYGGDDPHEPPSNLPKSLSKRVAIAEIDANLVTWDGPHDPENPKNWSNSYKWLITIVAIVMTVNVTFASSAPASTSRSLMIQFGISAEVSYLVTSCFLLGYIFGSLFWGPGSELVGRRPIFIVAMVLYTLYHLGQALALNIQTLLVTRFLSGFFAVAPLTNSSGVIADIFSAETRGSAASLFTAGVFLGPVLGPVVSGFIVESQVSWRWVYWVMMIFAGTCTLIMILLLPETYAPVILLRKAKRLRKADPAVNVKIYAEHERQDWSISGVIKRTIFRPFHMLAMEPVLILITIYVSIIYGLLYALLETLPIIFIERCGFTVRQDGLVFIGLGLGTTLGCLINARLSSHYPALIKKWKGFPPPEQRLRGAMIGAPTLVIAIFWLGWTGEYSSIPWYVPALSTVPLGMSISLTFITFLSYLIDTYLMYSASAFAANIIVRSAMAAAFPLFIVQMFTKLHINWTTTLLGLIALLFVPCPFLFFKYGSRIRAKSRFAPCIDLKIAKELEAEERRLAETKVLEI